MRGNINGNGEFCYVVYKHYFGYSGRDELPTDLVKSYLNTKTYPRWSQTFILNYRAARKRKSCSRNPHKY